MTSELHFYRADAIRLPDAFTAFTKAVVKANAAIVLLYTPRCCCFARVGVDGRLNLPPKPDCNPDLIFEARVFNASAELRWLRDSSTADLGTAVVIAPSIISDLASPFKADNPFPVIDQVKGRYLLWGKALADKDPSPDWSRLTAAQIGTLWVPASDVFDGGTMTLTYVEHLTQGEHGNVFVLTERLTGLEKAT